MKSDNFCTCILFNSFYHRNRFAGYGTELGFACSAHSFDVIVFANFFSNFLAVKVD